MQRTTKAVRRYLVYLLTFTFHRGIVFLRPEHARKFGAVVGGLGATLARGERQKVEENLEIAYGDTMPAEERKRIAREVFVQAGMSATEWSYLYNGRAEGLLSNVTTEGAEYIKQAMATGRGIIVLGAHYGNWELMAGKLPSWFPGREAAAVARDLSNPWINDALNRARTIMGTRVFTRGATGREYIRFLRAGNALTVLGDMDTTKGSGIFVNFFGKPAWTQDGIARLARMGKAIILPFFDQRDPVNLEKHVVKIYPPIPEPVGVSEEEYIRQITQSFTDVIEQAVRDRPELWMWMHRRWRHQPSDFPESQA